MKEFIKERAMELLEMFKVMGWAVWFSILVGTPFLIMIYILHLLKN